MSDAAQLRAHWREVYATRDPQQVSWYRPHLERSLVWIDALFAYPGATAVADIGGGAATLVDDLLARGFAEITVIDLAEEALAHSRARLGERASAVRWIAGDATTALLDAESLDLWHDRAVFHFLTDDARRAAYLEQLHRVLRPGGYALIATFAPDGPERCSGLPVRRHAPAEIAHALGPGFTLVDEARETHVKPAGGEQRFAYALCRRG